MIGKKGSPLKGAGASAVHEAAALSNQLADMFQLPSQIRRRNLACLVPQTATRPFLILARPGRYHSEVPS